MGAGGGQSPTRLAVAQTSDSPYLHDKKDLPYFPSPCVAPREQSHVAGDLVAARDLAVGADLDRGVGQRAPLVLGTRASLLGAIGTFRVRH